MPRKKTRLDEIRTQADLWHRFFVLLNTTNYIRESDKRRKAALGNDAVPDLSRSFIAKNNAQTGNWVTHPFMIAKLAGLPIPECQVGKNGTSFRDVIAVVHNSLCLHKVDGEALLKLSKTNGQVELSIMWLRDKEKEVVSDIQCDPNMIASNGGTVQAGQDVIFVRWQAPLRKPVGDFTTLDQSKG